jgi:hypothetical protein
VTLCFYYLSFSIIVMLLPFNASAFSNTLGASDQAAHCLF